MSVTRCRVISGRGEFMIPKVSILAPNTFYCCTYFIYIHIKCRILSLFYPCQNINIIRPARKHSPLWDAGLPLESTTKREVIPASGSSKAACYLSRANIPTFSATLCQFLQEGYIFPTVPLLVCLLWSLCRILKSWWTKLIEPLTFDVLPLG